MHKLLIIAALAAVSVGQPATARPVPDSATVLVQHSDLDLRTEQGTKALERRIWRAAVTVCGTASDFNLEGKNDVQTCRQATKVLASAKAAIVIADASRAQPIRVSSAAQ